MFSSVYFDLVHCISNVGEVVLVLVLDEDVATTSLADRAGEEEPAISLDREGWMSSKWGGMGDLDLPVRESPYIRWRKFKRCDRIHPAEISPSRASSRHIPRWLCKDVAFSSSPEGSLETAESDVSPGPGPRVL
jgi:hypothetical protein